MASRRRPAAAPSTWLRPQHRSDVPQSSFEDAVGHQLLDVADALVARAFELLERQLRGAIGLVELLGALARIPLRLEAGSTRLIFSKLTR